MTATQIATLLVRKHELGGNEHLAGTLICDKCGKPWKECSGVREAWLCDEIMRQAACPAGTITGRDIIAGMKMGIVCPGGSPTIAVGLNLYARKLCDAAINAQLEHDLAENEKQVQSWLGYEKLTEQEAGAGFEVRDYFDLLSSNRQAALLDLAHWGNIQSGKKLRRYILDAIQCEIPISKSGAYELAAQEILFKDGLNESKGRSGWYDISPTRAEELAAIIETDELPAGATQGESNEL